ncbi:protein expanded [Eupeodes corollae]|uniref:protein expanded n=1 Tax=Eupeodes corollae TaxID=290404 RepID=UPI002490AADE|nr:protein expanded [Eupeodes corollae]XP_055919541.1 protein expanded [Eupeodes corollae]
MRAFCTVSAPLEVCASSAEQLSPGSRFLALRLLGTQQPRTLYFLVDAKSRVREVYTQTCLHFATQGMLDTELFGLAVLIDGEYMFADPESKLSKYGPKSWRSSHTHGLDANGRPLLELHFRVQFYIESPFMLKDETSRHNYYLQLKENSLNRCDVPRDYSEQSMILLAGLALQADLGDCPEDEVTDSAMSSAGCGGTGSGSSDSNISTSAGPITTPAMPSSNKTLSPSVIISGHKMKAIVDKLSPAIVAAVSSLSAASSSSSINVPDYFRPDEYLPPSLRTLRAVNALRACHRENRGMSRANAELHYIQQACMHEGINAHMYRMKMAKSESGPGNSWFAVYAKGIKISSDNTQPTTFLWPNITKLSFERKKFEIRSGDNKIILYAASDEKNKMLLTLCKETHQFSMKIAARLKEVIKREEEESNSLHACYIYSRSLHLPYKNKNDQRISVISSTSSNTTSGIVSDRVHSEDELEIMINTPPAPIAAPSTESLALVHLLDRPSVSRQTSSVGQVSLKDLEDQLAALSVRQKSSERNSPTEQVTEQKASTDSPGSQHNIGSQCSSTCSTVVVATETTALTTLAVHSTSANRRSSTSSSLELGFSHTAQNSQLSEGESTCIDHDFIASTQDETESNSGVYTLAHGAPPTETSGVYTMHSSEMTGQSSEIAESESATSSHYGIFQPKSELGKSPAIDSVDGGYRNNRIKNEEIPDFRLRSDSNVSASGSFRGDGSDPTDNKHALLSAEELTDLIVGRGTYPCRKTVSNTLDSDCDYVTLPLTMEGESYIQGHEDTAPTEDQDIDLMDAILPTDPPAPPQRIDSNNQRSMANLSDIRMRSPPPYGARHETTGLCGPPIRTSVPKPVLRDPPPYQPKPRPTSLISTSSSSSSNIHAVNSALGSSARPEEVTARFITTRPQINILQAHTSVVSENPKPSYAAPTITSLQSQPSYMGAPTYSHPTQQSQISNVTSTIGIPIVPYQHLHATHKSMSAAIPPPPPPYPEIKPPPTRTCVLLPVIKPRQYLPPPPPSLPRQPPPPPPPQLATVYNASHIARKQHELYEQQLFSDVNYVIYPIQDPAISQQEYLDSKQSSFLAAMAQSPPPHPYLAYAHSTMHSAHHISPWDTCKGHAIYQSTPYLPMALSTHSRYASTQNLSDTYVQLPGAYSPLYSPSVASLCSSYEPPPPPPLHPATLANSSSLFARSRSDDNILNSIDAMPKMKRLPPPPPPPNVDRRLKKPPMPAPHEKPPPIPCKPSSMGLSSQTALHSTTRNIKTHKQPTHSHSVQQQQQLHQQHQQRMHLLRSEVSTSSAHSVTTNNNGANSLITKNGNPIDIQLLREKSRHLDLPLISALCNDRSLLKQTKAFGTPKNARSSVGTPATAAGTGQQMMSPQFHASLSHQTATKPAPPRYPGTQQSSGVSMSAVSAINASHQQQQQQLSKPRKASIHHRHPNDKLPPLPMQMAEANNYVMDPTPAILKHKSYNSQT